MAVQIKVDGKKVTIIADLTGTDQTSSGKSIMLAGTGGFVPVEGSDIKVSLDVIRPLKAKK